MLDCYDRARQPLQHERPVLPYPEVLVRTLEVMSRELACELPTRLREEFRGIASSHRPFSDSLATLRALKARGLLLGALSNIDDATFAVVLERLEHPFDIVVTAERVGAYKPDTAHFRQALDELRQRGIEQRRVLHVAQSRRADIVPANALGIDCVWIDRPGHVFGRRGEGAEVAKPTYRLSSLEELLPG